MDEKMYNSRGELSDGYDCFWTKLLVACLAFYLSAALVVAIVLMGRAPTANKQDEASRDAPLRILGGIKQKRAPAEADEGTSYPI